MNDYKSDIQAHLIEECTGRVICKPILKFAPSVGDEMRLSDTLYVVVKRLVWCLDEGNCPRTRLNIGVSIGGSNGN